MPTHDSGNMTTTYCLDDILDGPPIDAAVYLAPSAAHHARGQRVVEAKGVAWGLQWVVLHIHKGHTTQQMDSRCCWPARTNGVHTLPNKQV